MGSAPPGRSSEAFGAMTGRSATVLPADRAQSCRQIAHVTSGRSATALVLAKFEYWDPQGREAVHDVMTHFELALDKCG
jgi:hypothetical protein